ncbi:hypothetical protein hmeg3_15810 [Herbaspirillum sp. meg3]|uniref:SpaN/EivJ family type III secretion system needle length determinant n=1 Tax=Herbaspirillum sp. meg3 TaxID=2025949 RepID=UPI000B97F2DB|nr:hypothetical protein [Herbaspirillum sp. meg3]ASU39603.1 hypothetical protein hmeg3_15810 [Herbaspirillum sp. meg3]
MVEIKNGNTSLLQSAATAEKNVQSVQDRLMQAGERDRHNRDEADSIDQLVSTVQEMLPQMPSLGLRVETSGAPPAEKTGKAGKPVLHAGGSHSLDTSAGTSSRPQSKSVQGAGVNGAATGPQLTVMQIRRDVGEDSLSSPEASGIRAVAIGPTEASGGGRASAAASASSTSMSSDAVEVADAAARKSADAARDAEAGRKQSNASATDEMPIPAKPLNAENAQQAHKSGTANETMPAARTRAEVAAVTANAANAANSGGGVTQDGWVYQFRSWGTQHAVRVSQTPGMNSASSSSFAALALHPTSALVEQRLNAHGDTTGRSDQWLLQEHGEEGRQQQQGSRQQQQEEDES